MKECDIPDYGDLEFSNTEDEDEVGGDHGESDIQNEEFFSYLISSTYFCCGQSLTILVTML